MDGLLLVDKPTGMTSFDVIRQIRRVANTRKIGHTGTLDPQASGLLPLVVGRCTKLANFLRLDVKEYDFEMELGVETDTGDVEGDVVRECPWEHVAESALREACEKFVGDIEQVPPIYSAIKVRGKRAYELARKGEEFELDARPVTVESLDLVAFDAPRAKLHTRCGSGTYVRALVRDLGEVLDTCAYTTAIRRTVVGRFTLEEATPLGEFTAENFSELLLPPIEMVREFPCYTVDKAMCMALGYGQNIQPDGLDVPVDSYVAVANTDSELVAVTIARQTDEGLALRPKRVFKPQN